MDLNGRVFVVTGASSGIGLATAKALTQRGGKVALLARSKQTIEALAHELPGSLPVPVDMTDFAGVRRAIDLAQQHYGRIDGLVNNAGRSYAASIEEIDTKEKPSSHSIAGILSQLEVRYSKRDNRPFATFKFEDFTGQVEMMCWSDDYEKLKDVLANGAVLCLRIRVSKDQKTDGNRVTMNNAQALKPKAAKPRNASDPDPSLPPPSKPPAPPKPYVLRLNTKQHDATDLERIQEVLLAHPGTLPVFLEISQNGHKARLELDESFRVTPGPDLRRALTVWL